MPDQVDPVTPEHFSTTPPIAAAQPPVPALPGDVAPEQLTLEQELAEWKQLCRDLGGDCNRYAMEDLRLRREIQRLRSELERRPLPRGCTSTLLWAKWEEIDPSHAGQYWEYLTVGDPQDFQATRVGIYFSNPRSRAGGPSDVTVARMREDLRQLRCQLYVRILDMASFRPLREGMPLVITGPLPHRFVRRSGARVEISWPLQIALHYTWSACVWLRGYFRPAEHQSHYTGP